MNTCMGGDASVYYANNIFKFVSIGASKANEEENGYDGFTVRCELAKSRTNKAGQETKLVYNQAKGFDPALTLLEFARDNGLVGGARKNARYFLGHEDVKFNEKTFSTEFINRPELRFAIHDVCIPLLKNQLSRVDSNEVEQMNKTMGDLVGGKMELAPLEEGEE